MSIHTAFDRVAKQQGLWQVTVIDAEVSDQYLMNDDDAESFAATMRESGFAVKVEHPDEWVAR